MPAIMTKRSDLSIHHLLAAAQHARGVYAAETVHIGKAFGPFFEEIMWQVMGCVMMSVAAVEAHFNERMLDEKVDNIFLKSIERKGLIERHNLFLEFVKKPQFDVGKSPAQDFSDLVNLRDAFVHFHPEWSDQQVLHAQLEKRLARKFTESPFVPSGDVFFPFRCMSHGCAAWAVRTALNFGDAFANRIGIEPRFNALGARIATE